MNVLNGEESQITIYIEHCPLFVAHDESGGFGIDTLDFLKLLLGYPPWNNLHQSFPPLQ
jgi:hypothetical protein